MWICVDCDLYFYFFFRFSKWALFLSSFGVTGKPTNAQSSKNDTQTGGSDFSQLSTSQVELIDIVTHASVDFFLLNASEASPNES